MANPSSGRFTWHELMTTDTAAALEFYKGLFGWKVETMDMGPAGAYHVLSQGDARVAGMMKTNGGIPSNWLVYVGVDSADAAAKKVTELHGKVVVPPTTIPDMLRFAVATDPQGAAVGLLQPMGPSANQAPYDGPPRQGTFCWDELLTKDMDAATKFYGALFGWAGKMGEGAMKYWHWTSAGKEIGGMMTLMMPNVPPHWLGYVAVSDVDAMTKKVEGLHGKVTMPPMEIEKVGKFSVVQDPTGAVFALFRSARV